MSNEKGKYVECCGCGSIVIWVSYVIHLQGLWKSHKTSVRVASVQANTWTRYLLHTSQKRHCLRQSAQYFTKSRSVLGYDCLSESAVLHAIYLKSCYGQQDLKFS